jgi:hypothetical protein
MKKLSQENIELVKQAMKSSVTKEQFRRFLEDKRKSLENKN